MLLDARRATPGLRLEMDQMPQTKISTPPMYRLRAFGFPKAVKLLLWSKEFDHSLRQMASVFQVDRAGNVVEINLGATKRPRRLDEMLFGPGPYPRGALWEVALVSVDRELQAFAKATPYPITDRDGACQVTLQLVSHRGDKFLASGLGFDPGVDVKIESQYAARLIEKHLRISGDGNLPPHVILHATIAADRSARYTVKGRSCQVSVDYEWGEPALTRR
jgi:hypothetical protein